MPHPLPITAIEVLIPSLTNFFTPQCRIALSSESICSLALGWKVPSVGSGRQRGARRMFV